MVLFGLTAAAIYLYMIHGLHSLLSLTATDTTGIAAAVHDAPPRCSSSKFGSLLGTKMAMGGISSSSQSLYAYMFLIGGIDPTSTAAAGYQGFLYNVMVATEILHRQGSKADVWLYLQFSPNATISTLPKEETAALEALNIKVHTMERPKTASFTDINMEKFRLLNMTQYRRILFLDADILPLANLDYLFELSDGPHPLLQPNLVVASLNEPANGGFFMLEPSVGAYEALQGVISHQRDQAKKFHVAYPFFSKAYGWGHSFFEHNDTHRSIVGEGKRWSWHGAFIDQGLLYYWTKYHQQAVTAIRGHVAENWAPSTKATNTTTAALPSPKDSATGKNKKKKDGMIPPPTAPATQPFLELTMDLSLIAKYAPKNVVAHIHQCDRPNRQDNWICKPPYSQYAHFTGKKKPWQVGYNENAQKQTGFYNLRGPTRVFFETLFELSERLNLNITADNVNDRLKGIQSPLGYKPKNTDFAVRQSFLKTDNNTTTDA